MPALIEAMRAAYSVPANPAGNPPRSVARGEGVWLRTLSSVLPTGTVMGAKVFGSARVRGVSYLISLFDQETAELLALLDAKDITAMRTAATTAVGLESLIGDAPVSLGVLGSGMEAQSHLRAIAEVSNLQALRVFSPTPANRDKFAAIGSDELGIPDAQAVDNPEAVVREADVVLCAARSRNEEPVIQGDWLKPDATVLSIGSTLPEQREVDAETIGRAALIVADMPDEVMYHTGDMLAATEAGIDFSDRVCSLDEAVRGERQRDPESIAIYKSVGSGLQDLAAAELAYHQAVQHDLATELPLDLSIKRTPR